MIQHQDTTHSKQKADTWSYTSSIFRRTHIIDHKMKALTTSLSLVFVMGLSPLCQAQTLDQSQLQYDAAQSARNLPGYSTWQSFTAGFSGTLSQIDQGFVNPMTGTATLNIYSGNGTLGTLLYTDAVPISGTGTFWQSFPISLPVLITAGQMYTWQLVPTQGGGLPDPYGVQATRDTLAYPNGESTAGTDFDYVFRTFVSLSTGTASIETGSSALRIHPNPFSTETTLGMDGPLNNASLTLYNAQGQLVRQMNHLSGVTIMLERGDLASGLYSLRLSEDDRILSVGNLVITDN